MQVRALLDGQGWYDLATAPHGRLQHPLVAACRPADRRAETCCSRRSSAASGRDDRRRRSRPCCRCSSRCAAVAVIDPAADLALRLSACHHPSRLRRLGASACGRRCGSIITAGSSPSWPGRLAALTDPKRAARRRHARRSRPRCRWPSAWRCCSILPPRARSRCCSGSGTASARRLFAYGVTLAGGCALGLLVFASEANRRRCATRSRRSGSRRWSRPAWSPCSLGRISPARSEQRLALAAVGGVADRRRLRLVLARLPRPAGALARPSSSGSGSPRCARRMPIWRHGGTRPSRPPCCPSPPGRRPRHAHVADREALREAHVATAFGADAPPPATNDACAGSSAGRRSPCSA